MSLITENPAKLERRKEILDAAFLEFSSKGYAGASMEAIARRARASKETLYAWFKNKETLFNILFTARLDGMAGRTTAAAGPDPSAAKLLPIIAEEVIRFTQVIEPLIQAIGVGEAGDKLQRMLGETIIEERNRFVDFLVRARERGELDFDDDPFELASLFVAMAQGEWSMRLSTGMLDDLTDEMIETHARRVTRIFLKGIAPGTG
jgi:AcrR family transcriptional regulator